MAAGLSAGIAFGPVCVEAQVKWSGFLPIQSRKNQAGRVDGANRTKNGKVGQSDFQLDKYYFCKIQ